MEKFQEKRNKYDNDERIQKVNQALTVKQNRPAEFHDVAVGLDLNHKMAFMMFFEEIALLNNSGILNDDITFYTFGWDALGFYESDDFWDQPLQKDDPYWSLFRSFCEKMANYREIPQG